MAIDKDQVSRVLDLIRPALQADEIANAARYERAGERKVYRAGHYDRSLTAKAGRPGRN
mgnify:CR=1 FL=1